MFFERFDNLAKMNNTSVNAVAKELKLSSGSITSWKKKESSPNVETVTKIADYFNVTIDYLVGRTNDRTPLSNKQGVSIENDGNIAIGTFENAQVNVNKNNNTPVLTKEEIYILEVYNALDVMERHEFISTVNQIQYTANK